MFDRASGWIETALYVVIGAVLVVAAGLLLGEAAYNLATEFDDGVVPAAREALDTLLLTFIFVELFAAVRVTVRQQQLVAEPFFLVGIIAAIKEIVLLIGAEDLTSEEWETFRDGMIEVGVLAGVIFVLTGAPCSPVADSASRPRRRSRRGATTDEHRSCRSSCSARRRRRKSRGEVGPVRAPVLLHDRSAVRLRLLDHEGRGDRTEQTRGRRIAVRVHRPDRRYREACELGQRLDGSVEVFGAHDEQPVGGHRREHALVRFGPSPEERGDRDEAGVAERRFLATERVVVLQVLRVVVRVRLPGAHAPSSWSTVESSQVKQSRSRRTNRASAYIRASGSAKMASQPATSTSRW